MSTADALLIIEAREWDSIEYARDAVLSGHSRGIVLISHEAGEGAGMSECADWLGTFVDEVPVWFVPATDVIWSIA